MVGPSPNPGQAAAQVSSAGELQSREKLLHVICNYKVTFSLRLRYTNYLPNLTEKWLVLSRETKKGTSWLDMFQRGMFLARSHPKIRIYFDTYFIYFPCLKQGLCIAPRLPELLQGLLLLQPGFADQPPVHIPCSSPALTGARISTELCFMKIK